MFGIGFGSLVERGDQFALDFVRFLGAKGGCGAKIPVRNPAKASVRSNVVSIETAESEFQPAFARRNPVQRLRENITYTQNTKLIELHIFFSAKTMVHYKGYLQLICLLKMIL